MLGCKGFVFDGSFDTDYTLLTIHQIHFWENELHQSLTLSVAKNASSFACTNNPFLDYG